MLIPCKRIRLFLILWVAARCFTFGSISTVLPDTLQERFTMASDSEKVHLLCSLSLQSLSSSLNTSMEYAMMAKDIADSSRSPYLRAEALNRLGTVYYTYNHYQNAMDNIIEAITMRLQIHDSAGLSASYVNIGILYHAMGNLDKAIEFTQRALDIREKLGTLKNRGAILNNLLVYNILKKDYASALTYGQQALDFYLHENDGAGISDIYVNLGELYYTQKAFSKAIDYYRKAKQHAANIHDISRIININNSLITLLLDEKNNKEAGPLIKENIPLAENYGELDGLSSLYEQASRFYEYQKNFSKASFYQKKYQTTKDSLQELQQREKILQQQAKFNAELTAQQIRMIQQKNELQQLITEKDKHVVFRVILLIFFLMVLIIVLYTFMPSLKATIKNLKEHNLILSQTNEKLLESETKLQGLIASKDKFFSIIAHDIINPFQPLLGLSDLLINDIDKLKENEIRKYAGLIHLSATRIFTLLENLLHWTRTQTGNLEYHPVMIPLRKVVEEEVRNFRNQAKQKKISLTITIEDQAEAYGDVELFKGVIRNLVNNAIKFTPPKGKVNVSSEKLNDQVKIAITDTGVGMSKEMIDNLFNIETISSTKGTQSEEGTGLGLLLCKEFVGKNHGEIYVVSSPGKGSAFYFTIPVKPME